jgi:hypothetical protein
VETGGNVRPRTHRRLVKVSQNASDTRADSSSDHGGLVALLLTAGGYAAIYYFRIGQAQYFTVPAELVSLDLNDVVAGGITLTVLLLLVVFLGDQLLQFVEGELPGEVQDRLKALVITTFYFATFVYLLGAPVIWYLGVATAAATFAFMQFLLPVFTERRVSGYAAKLEADSRRTSSMSHSPLVRLLRGHRQLFLPFLGVALAVLLAQPAGVYSARTRVSFTVVPGSPDRVVVAEYEGSLVTLALDRESSTLSGPVEVHSAEGLANGLVVEELGPLRVVE